MAAIFGKDKLKFWIGLIISLVFLFLVFRGQDFGKIGEVLGQANYWWLIPALVFYFAGVFVRATRWHFLLKPLQNISPRRLFTVVTIGYMANDVLPARMGEIVRVYVLEKREGTSKTGALATIVVERIMDGLTILLLLAIASFFAPINKDIEGIERAASLLFIVLIVVFLAIASSRKLMLRLEAFGLQFLPAAVRPKLAGIADKFIDGLQVLRQWRDLVLVAALSILGWMCEVGMYWMVALAFSTLHLEWYAVVMTLAVANLSTLIPSAPGYVGPFDGAIITVLNGVFAIPLNIVSSFAILLHAALYFPVTGLGIFFWIREHLSLKEAEQEREVIAEQKQLEHSSSAKSLAEQEPETIEEQKQLEHSGSTKSPRR